MATWFARYLHGSINSKKQAGPAGLNLSVFIPLTVEGVLVTRDQAMGGARLVAL
jgi:hypothetical protein